MQLVRLTSKGDAFLRQMLPDHFQRIAALMQPLSEAERALLVRFARQTFRPSGLAGGDGAASIAACCRLNSVSFSSIMFKKFIIRDRRFHCRRSHSRRGQGRPNQEAGERASYHAAFRSGYCGG
jgi:hypothetical protein